MSVQEQYTHDLRERFGYSATWVPTLEVRLGDICRLHDYQYERVGTLANQGLQFEYRKGTALGTVDFSSSTGVQVSFSAAAEVPVTPAPTAGTVSVQFSREGAVLFRAEDCTVDSIEQQQDLELKILDLYFRGKWSANLVVVAEVVHAERATILISGGRNAGIELRGVGDLQGITANAGLQVLKSQNISTQIIAQGGLTPLFRAKGVRKRLLRQPTIVSRQGQREVASAEHDSSAFLSEVDYEHYS